MDVIIPPGMATYEGRAKAKPVYGLPSFILRAARCSALGAFKVLPYIFPHIVCEEA